MPKHHARGLVGALCAAGRGSLKISCFPASVCQLRPLAVDRQFVSTAEESGHKKGWSAQGSKQTRTSSGSGDGARGLPPGAVHNLSTQLSGGTVDAAEVDKFGAIGAVQFRAIAIILCRGCAATRPRPLTGCSCCALCWFRDGGTSRACSGLCTRSIHYEFLSCQSPFFGTVRHYFACLYSHGRRNRTYVDVDVGRIGTGTRRSDTGGVCTCRQSMMAQHLNRSLETRTTPQTALDGLRIVDVGCGGGILAEVNLKDAAACWALQCMRRLFAGPPPAVHLHRHTSMW